jgi:hypothetical protein
MKKYLYLFWFSLFVSLSAQNFIINGKYTKSFEGRFESSHTLELLFAPIPDVINIGVFFGIASLSFDFDEYKWSDFYEETNTRAIGGFIAYISPLTKIDYEFLQPIYLSLAMAKVSDRGLLSGGGYMFTPPGYAYPSSKNEKNWIISSGYKISFSKDKFLFLFGIGYHYREYDLTFSEYGDENYSINHYSIHQIEKFFKFDIGLQFVF